MEKNTPIIIKFEDSCRTCLTSTENMKHIVDASEEIVELLTKLAAITNSDVIVDETQPKYLCKSCEEKITSLYEFQQMCLRSNQIILDYIDNKILQDAEIMLDHSSDDKADDLFPQNVQEDESDSDSHSHASKSDFEQDKFIPREVSNRNSANQLMRLQQYSSEDVEKVISQLKQKFSMHRNCVFCEFTTVNTRALSVHITKKHSDSKKEWCIFCNKVLENLEEHMAEHAEDLKCQFCQKKMNTTHHLFEHVASHSPERQYVCYICQKSFLSNRLLKDHLAIHTNEKPFACKSCGRSYSRKGSLTMHKKNCKSDNEKGVEKNKLVCKKTPESSHNSKQIFRTLCSYCGKQFRTDSKLNLHLRIHTGETPYQCRYCDKKVKSKSLLSLHERTHTKEKPYVCDICEKSFGQSSTLKTHMRLHVGRPEKCDICGKRFCRPIELRIHMRKHTGEKPYLCNQCGQRFVQRSHLVEHTRTHSSDRPHKCDHCDKAFKHPGTLKAHVQIHFDQKPYKCPECSYACRQPYSLTQHIFQHNKNKKQTKNLHICTICRKRTPSEAHFRAHFERYHGEIPEEDVLNYVEKEEEIVETPVFD